MMLRQKQWGSVKHEFRFTIKLTVCVIRETLNLIRYLFGIPSRDELQVIVQPSINTLTSP